VSQIVEVVNLEVPVEAAYEQWANSESSPTFFTSVEEVTRIDATRHHWRISVAGSSRQFDTVITQQLANDRIARTRTAGEVDHGGVITFHKLSDSTSRVAVQIDWEAEGLAEKADAVLNVPDHAVKTELGHFTEHVEAAPSNSR
jgi:uncharacterized membrane protein